MHGTPPSGGQNPEDASPAGSSEGARARRLSPEHRRTMIVEQAAEFFASHGPAASTRDLARALGVTQALLYRYFPSKDALVREVYRERFAARWNPQWTQALRRPGAPLQERLTDFMAAYIDRLDAADYRLWMRAALEGWSFAALYHDDLHANVLLPIVAELRQEAGIRAIAELPAMYGEIEVAAALHGSLTFLRIRRDVYRAPMPPEIGPAIGLHVASFLPGALQQIRALHGGQAPPALTVPPLAG